MPEIINTKIVGVSKSNEHGRSRQEIIEDDLSDGDDLSLVREPENRYDKNAIAVYPGLHFDETDTDDRIGYLSGELAEKLAPKLDSGQYIECSILNITGGDEGKTLGVNIVLTVFSPEESRELFDRVKKDNSRDLNEKNKIYDFSIQQADEGNPKSGIGKLLKMFWDWYWHGIMQHGSSKARIFTILITLWLLSLLCSLPSALFPPAVSTQAEVPQVNIQTAVAIESARVSTEISAKATQTQAALVTPAP
ncbi:hypothetical protein hrd7_25030 [Leptolinea sp. HRD-7]|nr:hypothetical protein hrd7_25030 [Leptolinea sp. HRD-7]